MAQQGIAQGTKFYDITTGKEFTAPATQDIGGGQQGVFINLDQYSLTQPIQTTQPIQGSATETLFSPNYYGSPSFSGFTPTERVNVELPNELDSGLIGEATLQPKTDLDIQKLVDERKAGREKLLGALEPTEQEIALRNELGDVRQKADQLRQSFEEGLLDVEGQPVAMGFIVGQARELEKRANLKLSSLQRQETNLLNRLGLEEELRKTKINVLETGLSFIKEDIDLQFKIDARLKEEEDRLWERLKDVNTISKDRLATILDLTTGLDFDDLAPQEQQKLVNMAASVGIPSNLLISSMKVAKDQYLAKQANENAQNFIIETVNGQRVVIDRRTNDVVKILGTAGIRGGGGGGGGTVSAVTSGFSNAKTENDVRQTAVDALNYAEGTLGLSGADSAAYAFDRTRRLFSPQEASDDAIRGILGLQPAFVEEAAVGEEPLPGEVGYELGEGETFFGDVAQRGIVGGLGRTIQRGLYNIGRAGAALFGGQ